MTVDGILFDLDGTLWDAVEEILLTWNSVIEKHGHRAPITRLEMESLMGLQMDEIANRLFSAEPAGQRMKLMEACMLEENYYLEKHGATLYPAVEKTLEYLHKQYQLYIVSNCQRGYIEAFLHAHNLGRLFDGFLSYGDTLRSKGENIRKVVQSNQLHCPVYVGDTQGDLNAATFAEIPFIYAEYGFGEVMRYDAKITAFHELGEIFS